MHGIGRQGGAGRQDGIELQHRIRLQHWIGLQRRSGRPDHKAKLDVVAEVERLTHRRLHPIAQRLGIHPVEAEWRPVVERRANELAALSWSEFIDKALWDWPPYIDRFAALRPLAPAGDAAVIRHLVNHEVALVQFAHREREAPGSTASLRVLQEFLAQRFQEPIRVFPAVTRNG